MKKSFIFLADGFETIEALTPLDVMRRAGMPVQTVSITSNHIVTSAQDVKVTADLIYDPTLFTDPLWLILPGGMPGATNLRNFAPLAGLLRQQYENPKGRIAAICASPAVVLGSLGLLKGHKATCYPGFESELRGAQYEDVPIITDDKFVLGNGPANALPWSLAIVKHSLGELDANHVAGGMLFYRECDDTDNFFG